MNKVIITWVTKGIWKSLCKKYLKEWYWVIGISSNQANLDTLELEISSTMLELLKCDIWDSEDIINLSKSIRNQNIISLINNVWVWYYSQFSTISNEKIVEIINVNLVWTMTLTKAVLENCIWSIKNITFVSSLAGKVGFNGLAVYSATKHWIEWFSDALRDELNEKIKVLVVRPWIVDTNFFEKAEMEEYTKDLKNKMQTPELIANEIYRAWKYWYDEITIWKDKWFLFLRRFVPKSLEKKLLSFFIS
jgi:short-subunit dehydrogenase